MAKSNPFTLADLEAKGFVKADDGTYQKMPPPYDKTLIVPFPAELLEGKSVKVKKTSRPKASIPKPEPIGLVAIKNVLKAANISFVTERKFSEERKFRFDISVVLLAGQTLKNGGNKLAIEYEGTMSAKSRHTTFKGYATDCDKYNLAQIEGWIVLRYTAINYKNFVEDLKKLL